VLKEILNSERLQALHQALQENHSVLAEELWNAPKALIAALAQQVTGKHILILTGASQEEIRLYNDFSFFTERSVVDFPAWETLPSENISPSPDIVGERYKVLHELSSSKEPRIILSGLQACLQKLLPPRKFCNLYMTLRKGDTCSFNDLIQLLPEMGYTRQSVASEKGEFAIRGGIVDIFPVSSPDPFRIEFWGDEIESIRIYDPIGQKSVKSAEEVSLPPAQEMELIKGSETLSTILDYLGPNTIIIFDDLLALEDRYASLTSMGSHSSTFCTIDQFLDQLAPFQKIFWSNQPIEELSEVHLIDKMGKSYYSETAPMHGIAFHMFNRKFEAKRWQHVFSTVADFLLPENEQASGQEVLFALGKLSNSDYSLHFLCATEAEQTTLQKRILDASVHLPKHTDYHLGYLSSGLVVNDVKQIIFPMTEITRRYKIRRQKQRSTYHTLPSEFSDLIPGEMIVHLNHGIGKFLGLEKKPNHLGVPTEFFLLEFADNAKLYVPLNQAHLISRYIGSDESVPKMHTLGSTRWKKAKESTERAILEYAADLLQLYAQREMTGGFKCGEDSPDVKAFEEDFPYVETEDQLAAIFSVKEDMMSAKAMDRLICGDVGYGKTEVAMRAAFCRLIL